MKPLFVFELCHIVFVLYMPCCESWANDSMIRFYGYHLSDVEWWVLIAHRKSKATNPLTLNTYATYATRRLASNI